MRKTKRHILIRKTKQTVQAQDLGGYMTGRNVRVLWSRSKDECENVANLEKILDFSKFAGLGSRFQRLVFSTSLSKIHVEFLRAQLSVNYYSLSVKVTNGFLNVSRRVLKIQYEAPQKSGFVGLRQFLHAWNAFQLQTKLFSRGYYDFCEGRFCTHEFPRNSIWNIEHSLGWSCVRTIFTIWDYCKGCESSNSATETPKRVTRTSLSMRKARDISKSWGNRRVGCISDIVKLAQFGWHFIANSVQMQLNS